MRIFILDDEPSIVDVLSKVCVRSGHDVASAVASLDALDYLAKNPVDLLVADISMPPPDGLQVIREVRVNQPNLIALAMTGYLTRYSLADIQTAGASDLIYKPLRMDEFRARIAFADQQRRMVESLNSRRRELQQMSADMITGLQDELEELRQSVKQKQSGRAVASATRASEPPTS
jgi:DNA-binding response OmpR family regulator